MYMYMYVCIMLWIMYVYVHIYVCMYVCMYVCNNVCNVCMSFKFQAEERKAHCCVEGGGVDLGIKGK